MTDEWDLEADWRMIRPQPVPENVWLVIGSSVSNIAVVKMGVKGVDNDGNWITPSHSSVRGREVHSTPDTVKPDTPGVFKTCEEAEEHFMKALWAFRGALNQEEVKLVQKAYDLQQELNRVNRNLSDLRKDLNWANLQLDRMPPGRHTEMGGEVVYASEDIDDIPF